VREVKQRFPAVQVIALLRNYGAAARNEGVLRAQTPYIAFSDDDSAWASGALATAAGVLDRHPSIALVAARTLVGVEAVDDPGNGDLAVSPLPGRPGYPGPRVLGFLACAAVVRRGAFLDVGGFRPGWGLGAEEHLLALDLAVAGWDLVYDPRVVAHHYPDPAADRVGRRTVVARNDAWTAWLRYPVGEALRRTARLAGEAARDHEVRRGLGRAVRGARPVFRHRRPVSRAIAADLVRLRRGAPHNQAGAG